MTTERNTKTIDITKFIPVSFELTDGSITKINEINTANNSKTKSFINTLNSSCSYVNYSLNNSIHFYHPRSIINNKHGSYCSVNNNYYAKSKPKSKATSISNLGWNAVYQISPQIVSTVMKQKKIVPLYTSSVCSKTKSAVLNPKVPTPMRSKSIMGKSETLQINRITIPVVCGRIDTDYELPKKFDYNLNDARLLCSKDVSSIKMINYTQSNDINNTMKKNRNENYSNKSNSEIKKSTKCVSIEDERKVEIQNKKRNFSKCKSIYSNDTNGLLISNNSNTKKLLNNNTNTNSHHSYSDIILNKSVMKEIINNNKKTTGRKCNRIMFKPECCTKIMTQISTTKKFNINNNNNNNNKEIKNDFKSNKSKTSDSSNINAQKRIKSNKNRIAGDVVKKLTNKELIKLTKEVNNLSKMNKIALLKNSKFSSFSFFFL
jgi:hypothetical protein